MMVIDGLVNCMQLTDPNFCPIIEGLEVTSVTHFVISGSGTDPMSL